MTVGEKKSVVLSGTDSPDFEGHTKTSVPTTFLVQAKGTRSPLFVYYTAGGHQVTVR